MKLSKEERQYWINRWKRLKPSPRRDMAIKMWEMNLNQNKDDKTNI